ncbi:MAG: ankyrin repeat domain-containing protein [Myxococcota bacterium]
MSKNPASEFFEGPALVLGMAIESARWDQVEQLAQQVPLNTHHQKQMTFLHFALLKQQPRALTLLIRRGADPLIEVKGLGTALGVAVMAEKTVFLKAIFEAGVGANVMDPHGMPYFFHAATKDNLEALQLFIERGANLNLTTPAGRSVVLHAFFRTKYDAVAFLIQQGVALELPTTQGVTLANALQKELLHQQVNPQTQAYQKLSELKHMLEKRGVRFPVETAEQVRLRLKP